MLVSLLRDHTHKHPLPFLCLSLLAHFQHCSIAISFSYALIHLCLHCPCYASFLEDCPCQTWDCILNTIILLPSKNDPTSNDFFQTKSISSWSVWVIQKLKPWHSKSKPSMCRVNCRISLTGWQRHSQTYWFKLTQIHWISSSYMRGRPDAIWIIAQKEIWAQKAETGACQACQ